MAHPPGAPVSQRLLRPHVEAPSLCERFRHPRQGSNCSVYAVRYKASGRLFALKVSPNLDQSFLPPLVASWHDSANYYLLTVLAVEQLHKLHTLHRDVKPSNVLFNAHGDVVLGDFGFSKSFEEEEPTEYSGDAYSFETDVWGLGMLMLRMLAGRLPFGAHANTDAELRVSYRDDPILFKDEEGLDDTSSDLISKMLAKDPAARATIPEVKRHLYFGAVPPCSPRTPFIPKVARPALIVQGSPYQDLADPLPGFAFVSSELFKPPQPAPGKRETWVDRVRNAFKGKTPSKSPVVLKKSPVGPKTPDTSATVCGSIDGNKTPAPSTKTTAKFSFAGFFKRVFSFNLKAKDASLCKPEDADKSKAKTEAFPTQSWAVPAGKNGENGVQTRRSLLSRMMGWWRRRSCVKVEMGQAYRIDLTQC
ncbi:kinase-like domain-containing protein [Mycena rebaudengoi]|nr:kinase-like domain-containing protein [Mycena rebaudengoi]